jgi:hypothetical protein
MKKLTTFFLVLSLLLLFCISRAQEVISSSGATQSSANVQLSWTVGEPIVDTYSSGSVILTQGFHQSKLIVTAIDPIPLAGFELEVYPNPTSAELNIKLNNGNFSNLRYSLYNSQGEQIRQQEFSNQVEQINLTSFAPGYYLLKIERDTCTPALNFKIVKY